jgi:two-component system OmpR family sensor kinase
MLDSVRVRLTFWYTGSLAVALLLLSLATYFVLRQNTIQRTDSSLAELADSFLTTVHAELQDPSAPEPLQAAAQAAIVEHNFRDYVFAVLDTQGRVVVASQDLSSAAAPAGNFPESLRVVVQAASASSQPFGYLRNGGRRYRGYVRRFSAGDQTYLLVVLQSLQRQEEFLSELTRTFALVIPLVVVLASAGGYFLARRSLAPVVAMSAQAGRIGAATLHERLPVRNERDELGRLARSFNELLDRLDQSFERQRRFMADASHELRTPVAILRGEAEVALAQLERPPGEYREALEVLRAEAQRLARIVEDLFTLARADAGQLPLTQSDFYLDDLAADCLRTVRTLALAKGIQLTCDLAEELPVHGDEGLLRRMLVNLLDNAIKFTGEGGSVTLVCRREGASYALGVTDTGPGIPPELQPRVFERFFRMNKARSHAEGNGGAGLGLSIASWIAGAHGGRLELTRSDSSGSTFTAFLPAPPAAELVSAAR